jgi:hypothetical protein
MSKIRRLASVGAIAAGLWLVAPACAGPVGIAGEALLVKPSAQVERIHYRGYRRHHVYRPYYADGPAYRSYPYYYARPRYYYPTYGYYPRYGYPAYYGAPLFGWGW